MTGPRKSCFVPYPFRVYLVLTCLSWAQSFQSIPAVRRRIVHPACLPTIAKVPNPATRTARIVATVDSMWRGQKTHLLPCQTVAANEKSRPLLDSVLSRLTSAFPLFVLSSAIFALRFPRTLTWVNQGEIISWMLASVMCGTGLTLEKRDFVAVFQNNWQSVPLGVLCQFIIMPAAAWAVGQTLLLHQEPSGPALFLGLCLVGCSPGGTASNLVSLIAHADVALSVILTACSTLLAVIMTPLLVKLLVGTSVAVSGLALCQATARVILLPVVMGMLINARFPRLARFLSRFTPFASVLLVCLICGGVVAQNANILLTGGGQNSLILLSVVALHAVGFAWGYIVPRLFFQRDERSARTISIEVGMQNSALAVVLARSIGAPTIAGLPGALSATAHSCLGSILAAIWRIRPTMNNPTTRLRDTEHDGRWIGDNTEDYSI